MESFERQNCLVQLNEKKKIERPPLRRPLIEPRPWHFFSGGSGDKKIRNQNKRKKND